MSETTAAEYAAILRSSILLRTVHLHGRCYGRQQYVCPQASDLMPAYPNSVDALAVSDSRHEFSSSHPSRVQSGRNHEECEYCVESYSSTIKLWCACDRRRCGCCVRIAQHVCHACLQSDPTPVRRPRLAPQCKVERRPRGKSSGVWGGDERKASAHCTLATTSACHQKDRLAAFDMIMRFLTHRMNAHGPIHERQ